MMYKLASGIPSEKEYEQCLESNLFKSMEEFSNRFLERNDPFLNQYKKRWVSDPLHQWSRQ